MISGTKFIKYQLASTGMIYRGYRPYRQVTMSEEADPAATLAALRTALSSVEETLGPLLEKKWNDTTASLGTMDRAKMDILVSYAINDLIWGKLSRSDHIGS